MPNPKREDAGVRVQLGIGDTAFPEVAALLSDAFAEYPVEMSFTPATLQAMCAVDDVVLDACALARDHEGRLLGVGLAARRGDCGRIAAMGIAREAQGRGIGRALGKALLASLARAGARRVILEALTDNAPALALYETHLGFGRRRRLIGFERPPGGEPIEPSRWEEALSDRSEPDSWQLAHVVRVARTHEDLVFVPAVVPEAHPVAHLLHESGFAPAQVDQYELERLL